MKPLINQVIISTRPLSADDTLHDNLIQKGATVIEFPMIEIVTARLNEKIKLALQAIYLYDWIIFTSKNGVSNFFKLLEKIRCSKDIPPTVKIATIGNTTTEEVRKNGAEPFFVSSGTTSADLLKELSDGRIKFNELVLLPLGNLAKDTLEKGLTDLTNPTRLNVYETLETKIVSPEIIERIRQDNYDLIVFTSTSGFINFMKIMKKNFCMKEFRMACIGSSTEKEILLNGYKPLVVSAKPDGLSFANEIEKYFTIGH